MERSELINSYNKLTHDIERVARELLREVEKIEELCKYPESRFLPTDLEARKEHVEHLYKILGHSLDRLLIVTKIC